MKFFVDIFGWFFLVIVVNNKIFVIYGGIFNIIDLFVIDKIDRYKVSVLNYFFSYFFC